MKAPAGQVAVSAGVLALGAAILVGSFNLPTGGGYAQVGPGVVPRIVGVILVLLGAALAREAFTGGFRGVDEEAEVHLPMDWRAFAWITGGIFIYGALIQSLGFVLSSVILYAAVARSFGSRRYLLNAVVGLLLASFIFAVFNYGLGLTLPPGVLKPLLPTA
jgi:putative tricarboxylic transport membrane protein